MFENIIALGAQPAALRWLRQVPALVHLRLALLCPPRPSTKASTLTSSPQQDSHQVAHNFCCLIRAYRMSPVGCSPGP